MLLSGHYISFSATLYSDLLMRGGGDYITHLRKLEKAATVAFMEMPQSAKAKLKTRKLLGVLSSLTLRKATIVTMFKKKPRRP